MSVINKVLRDLDQRQAGMDSGQTRQTGPGARLTRGTVPLISLTPSAHRMSHSLRWVAVAAALFVVGGMVFFWYLPATRPTAKPVTQVLATPVAPAQMSVSMVTPAPTLLASAPAPVESMKIAAPEPVTVSPVQPSQPAVAGHDAVAKAQTLAADASSKAQKKPASVVSTVKATDRAGIAPETTGDAQFLRMESTLQQVPNSANSNSPQGVVQRSTNETLAQVQSLWNSGSHTAATELLQQALTQVESSSAVAAPVTGQSALARIARELARLNLVDGQVSQALALLTRLEPQLAQIADLWAMRANAAQRLGQHAEAVKSYKQALILKPDEPRWMSGQAVSMAAQGQIVAAGEMAEKARAFGALRPEVATYLRQLGVSVRMD